MLPVDLQAKPTATSLPRKVRSDRVKPATITDEQIRKARKLLTAEKEIIEALAKLEPERRLAVLRAAAILHNVEL